MPNEDDPSIPVEIQIEALISLRILSREQFGISELTSSDALKKLLKFAGLSGDVKLTLSKIMKVNSGLAVQGKVNTPPYVPSHKLIEFYVC